ncbi:MAG TPA: hypothetical protein EYH17_01895 [Pyrodictium sp.]|nr:hypothetical protein [Pyrodictium sp.]
MLPLEGWLIVAKNNVFIVKDVEQPFPYLRVVPRLLNGRKIHVEPHKLCTITRCLVDPCLNVKIPLFMLDSSSKVISPFEAANSLNNCKSKVCYAAKCLLELLQEVGYLAGISGSLAYKPYTANDIDIVVYGNSEEAYMFLKELRQEGITKPLYPNNIYSNRLLFGKFLGIPYSIRLVSVTKPRPCIRRVLERQITFVAKIVDSIPYTTPAYYLVEVEKGVYAETMLLIRTLRLRYTELNCKYVIVKGVLERVCDNLIVSPDVNGYIVCSDAAPKSI